MGVSLARVLVAGEVTMNFFLGQVRVSSNQFEESQTLYRERVQKLIRQLPLKTPL
jgi:hypothetical protein